jgi:hypothetical protein
MCRLGSCTLNGVVSCSKVLPQLARTSPPRKAMNLRIIS